MTYVADRWSPVSAPIYSDSLHIRWQEIGSPEVVEPTRTGFGSKLIQRVLASEIGGRVSLRYPQTGVEFEAVAPLPEQPIDRTV